MTKVSAETYVMDVRIFALQLLSDCEGSVGTPVVDYDQFIRPSVANQGRTHAAVEMAEVCLFIERGNDYRYETVPTRPADPSWTSAHRRPQRIIKFTALSYRYSVMHIAPSKVLPSGDRRAMGDVTFVSQWGKPPRIWSTRPVRIAAGGGPG